ncbi:MAG: type II secretion system GspH family protein [Azoarcus sp.]|jgi:type II secretory pathway pseudopilin PulG|nr:type II secretion system GspH family protein [Azoarcus sp.]
MPSFSAMRGFQLLELAVVLSVLGVLTLMTTWAFSGVEQKNIKARSAAETEVAREAIRAFLLANKRLPCPDTGGDGYEDCAVAGESGFLPYLSLGLTDNAANRMRYSVYRNGDINVTCDGTSINHDITRLVERTCDADGAPDFRGYGDTLAALAEIRALPSGATQPDINHIHVAGINSAGNSVCATGSHPAFALVVPNEDKNADGNLFDGSINVGGVAACLASPLQPFAWNYDDFVLSESSTALMGWLTQHLNN